MAILRDPLKVQGGKMNFNDHPVEIPEEIPLLPVKDLVVFPYMILPLFINRSLSLKAVEESLSKNRLVFLATQKNPSYQTPNENDIYTVGTIAMIMRMRNLPDGRVKILVQGMAKGKIKSYKKTEPYFSVSVEKIEETEKSTSILEKENLIQISKELLQKIIAYGKPLSPDILLVLDDVNDMGRMANLIISNLGVTIEDCQRILEIEDSKERLMTVNDLLNKELEFLKIKSQQQNHDSFHQQKENILKEQVRAMRHELGEGDSRSEEAQEIREKLLNAKMPENVEKEALKQLGRLEKMHPDTSEASMIRNYLDWLSDMPWAKKTEDNLNLENAKKILDQDHYDLEKIKERVLEFLAVRKLKNDMKGPILCFAGPPGVGKTSLGKSIAKAMGRKYVRLSLGGTKDESEIRGHRRTYVGAMPGKIIQGLKQAQTKNPVIVLDEIDKMGSDFRGDPGAAMLEVLDPEQNSTFRDNYLNVDFDLSDVLFMATANMIENIPSPLRDRMEVINLSGYTENDKLTISKSHLVQKEIENNGLNENHITFTDDGLKHLISHYTKEAGVRNLQREIGSLCRKVALKVVSSKAARSIINKNLVGKLLGPPKFLKEDSLKERQPGVVTGMAWTQVGGEILHVEALKMKGKGQLVLTGQMGDVMKESAKAAMSYAKAHVKELDICENWFENNEVHVHIPAGAIPKDGPSAGVTIATALISLITNRVVHSNLAMTGEVTLTGRVLPVGGIKEKSLAALNHGITNVILPFLNKKDIAEIPDELKEKINFIFVENLDEVLTLAFSDSLSQILQKPQDTPEQEDTQISNVATG